jgi:phage repressor protein C with HTH and peptisase S24 domain
MGKQPKAPGMLSHGQIWAALDQLAERSGLSPSGLARRSGLDPTTFNKSKRITSNGRERWPSTESLAKALAATNTSIESFLRLIGNGAPNAPSLPSVGFAQAATGGYFDENGYPAGKGWDEAALPSMADEHAYALEIGGDSMKPAYRDGDIIVVSPATPIRRGDRVVVKTKSGELLAGELKRRTAKSVEMQLFGSSDDVRALAASDVSWIARIVWATQ